MINIKGLYTTVLWQITYLRKACENWNRRRTSKHCSTLLIQLAVFTSLRQPHKMVKHTQKIRRLLLTNYLSAFDQFCGIGAYRVNLRIQSYLINAPG